MSNVFEAIRDLKGKKGSLVIELKTNYLKIPLNDKDKLAVDVLDYMADKQENLTAAEISEVCDYIKFYMELAQILDTDTGV